jgi:ATP-binding cassette subfamily F protein 3
MSLLQLISGVKSYGVKELFSDASFSVNENEHIGVIGPNGAGKTTLFRILAGMESLDSGEIAKKKGLRIGYLQQHDDWSAGQTVESFLTQEQQLPTWEIKSLGRNLGLDEKIYSRHMSDLSGGYKTRVKLLYLLAQQADLLLLDEPTNYLDLESTLILESFLQTTDKAFLLISHDQEFLRRTSDHILEIEQGDFTKFNGNLDDYFEQKELLRTQLEAKALSQAQKKKEILDFVSRFGAKASKARQAQSRLKRLDKMEEIQLKSLPVGAKIHIPTPDKSGKWVYSLKNGSVGYPQKTILINVNFEFQRGDHIAIVGVNGAGKSTLLKTIAGLLAPLSGTWNLGHDVRISYFAQHISESLNPNFTIEESLQEGTDVSISRQEVLNLAGALLFSGDDIHKKISVLSGGEKSRVALGKLLLKKSNFLILDEPTNHLDFMCVEALASALDAFEGTVLFVSHDRSFVKKIAKKIIEVRNQGAVFYPGSYDDYVWIQQKEFVVDSESKPPKISVPRRETRDQNKEASQIEKQINQLEIRIREMEGKIANISEAPQTDQTRKELSKLTLELSDLMQNKTKLEDKWLEIQS